MKRILAAIALLALSPLPAQAQDTYPSLAEIPAPLLPQLGQGMMEARFVAQVAGSVRGFTREKDALTLAVIEDSEKKQQRERSRNRLREVLRYDRDFDMKVTRAEIEEEIGDNRRQNESDIQKDQLTRMIDEAVARIMRYDDDKDGVVTAKEAANGKDEGSDYSSRRGDSARALLALDPDGDGTLTAAEAEALARKAFRTADKDGNGEISLDEAKALIKLQRLAQLKERGCTLPAPSAAAKIVSIGTVGGGAWSDVALGSMETETDTVALDIAQGAEPLYLLLASQRPVIWRITGDAARIEKLVLAGPSAPQEMIRDGDMITIRPSEGEIQSGVTGLSEDKVFYMEGKGRTGCLSGFAQVIELSGGTMRQRYRPQGDDTPSLKDFIGRDADTRYSGFAPVALRVALGKVVPAEVAAAPEMPPGFDADTWKIALLYQPGGVVSLKDSRLVTKARPKAYDVLPGWAGLAQLAGKGFLKAEKIEDPATRVFIIDGDSQIVLQNRGGTIVNNSDARIIVTPDTRFRILKPLEGYPPGLDGSSGVQLVLPKGIALPETRRSTGLCIQPEEGAVLPKGLRPCN